jgi:hypothetical protein
MFELIREIINEWDPFNLLRYYCCPPDEYDHEVQAILEHINETTSAADLSIRIEDIFRSSFGPSTKIRDTLPVAEKILRKLIRHGCLPPRASGAATVASSFLPRF